jgi:maltose alpha-D-glucosyltransferase/alpha-amylase
LLLDKDWIEVFSPPLRDEFAALLQQWVPSRRWFRGKARTIESVNLREEIPVPLRRRQACLLLLQVNYADGEPELYVLPVAAAFGWEARMIERRHPQLIVARLALGRKRQKGLLYDAIVSKDFCHALLALTAERRRMAGQAGDLESEPTPVLQTVRRERGLDIPPKVSKAEQSNSSIIYGGCLILKFFRRLDAGVNPELEMERFLSARHFPWSPPLAGALEYHDSEGRGSTVAVLTSFIPGCHDAWEDTLRELCGFYQKIQTFPVKLRQAPPWPEAPVIGAQAARPVGRVTPCALSPAARAPADLIGAFLQDAATLGRRTAALHLTLASDATDPAFRPEPWTRPAQQSLFDSLRRLTRDNLRLLRRRLSALDPAAQAAAERVLALESVILRRLQRFLLVPAAGQRIRNHGDFHLGQVLHHGPDFLIIDFEGEPALSLDERRAKQSALRDVAGMIYSFFYASHVALRELAGTRLWRSGGDAGAAWARYWSVWVGTNFLRAYLETARSAAFVPGGESALKAMLDFELLRKAIYELGYELNNRPAWVAIACQVLLDLLNPESPL